MNNNFEPGDIVKVTFFKQQVTLRCVENWGDQLLLVDDEYQALKIAPVLDCELIEKRDPPPRPLRKRR